MSAPSSQADRATLGLTLAAGGASLAGLLFGFDTAVISGTTSAITHLYSLDPLWLGITVSAALWGTLIGALVAGSPGDRCGSRAVLMVVAGLFLLGAAGSALAWSWPALILFRVITGTAVGGASVLAPVYLSELAPAARRGRIVVLFQLNIIIGILLAYVSNAVVARLIEPSEAWRFKFAVGIVPALLLVIALCMMPESPRWLIGKGRAADALRTFKKLGRSNAEAEAEAEAATRAVVGSPKIERLSWTRHSKPITLAVLIALFNQLSGINALLYYSNDIFAAAGGGVSGDLQAIEIGGANAVFTVIGLLLIDKAGRKRLLVVGSLGMSICLLVAGLALTGVLPHLAVLAAFVGFIAFFASTAGAVIWVYLSEIFPTPVRSRGSALGASVHWGANAIIATAFPLVAAVSVGLPFFVFAVLMLIQALVVSRIFPETSGLSLESIDNEMARADPPLPSSRRS